MKDRLPPFALESEMAVIGCCLNDPAQSIPEAALKLTPANFYDERCKLVWNLISGQNPSLVNIISVRQMLKDAGDFEKVGIDFLGQCQDAAVSSANLPVWIEELENKRTLRQIIQVATNAAADAYAANGGAMALLDRIESQILKIRPNQLETTGIKALVQQAINKIEVKCLTPDAITGLSTGLIDLDRLTDGLHPGEMIVVAALPSRGKTVLAVNIVVHNALAGTPAAIYTAEMRPVQLVVRSICAGARVNFRWVKTTDIPAMTSAAYKLTNAPLYIEPASGFTINQLRASARRLKQKHNIQLIAVDYQQLLAGEGDNKEQQVSSISKGIKAMALELDLPVLLLSQINDKGETKYARATTEDADSLWKLENDGEWQTDTQPIDLNVEKCRDGSTGQVKLTFLKTFTKFESTSKVSDEDVPTR